MSYTSELAEPSKNSVRVEILGQTMLLRSDGEAEHVMKLAAFVQSKIDEISSKGPVVGTKLAVLAALNVAEEYFQLKLEMQRLKAEVAETSRAMLAELNDAGNF
jgi:cell division protein ZapA